MCLVISQVSPSELVRVRELEFAIFGAIRSTPIIEHQPLYNWMGLSQMAWNDDAPVGFALVCLDPEVPSRAWLYTIGVLSYFRHQDVGQALLNHVVAACTSQGLKEIRLQVEAHNLAAVLLYSSAGFEEITDDINRDSMQSGDAAITMTRVLNV